MRLSADVVGDPSLFPVDSATVLVDQVSSSDPPTIDRAARKLTAVVKLHTGLNKVSVVLGNRWGQAATYGPVEVTFPAAPAGRRSLR